MISWEQRAPEVANLLNPAFCAFLLREAIKGYREETTHDMPYPLAYIILPLALHKATRECLPTTRTKLLIWLQDHQEIKIRFANRVSQLVPFTKEAILYGSQFGLFGVTSTGQLYLTRKRLKKAPWVNDSEPAHCRDSAHFLGRWLGQAGDTATVFAVWGITP